MVRRMGMGGRARVARLTWEERLVVRDGVLSVERGKVVETILPICLVEAFWGGCAKGRAARACGVLSSCQVDALVSQ